MKKYPHRRMLAALLSVVLCVSVLSLNALAESPETADSRTPYIIHEPETVSYTPGKGTSPDDLFAEYANGLFYPGVRARSGAKSRSAGDSLEGITAQLYTILKSRVAEVAAGEQTSTVFSVDMSELTVNDTPADEVRWTAKDLGVSTLIADGKITEEAIAALQERLPLDLDAIVRTLLADCPFDLYWYDKTVSTQVTGYRIACDGSTLSVFGELGFYFPVAAGYSAGEFTVDPEPVRYAQNAAVSARAIVEQASGLSDLQKLQAYKNKICELVSYNSSAPGSSSYGDPWQLIWVFDGVRTTNVVCEGYSKAFQYLCDLSSFPGGAECISVSGTMTGGTGAGPHMWNIVRMGDGKSYLADVTNSDSGTVGEDGSSLFLSGCSSGSAENGYVYEAGGGSIFYVYDADTRASFSEAWLTMSETAYEEEPGPTFLAEGSCGSDLTWTLDTNGTLTIRGTGAMYPFPSANHVPWQPYTGSIVRIDMKSGITEIGNYAFSGCDKISSIDIPSTVTTIGDKSFYGCTGLAAIDLPDNLTAIGNSAFMNCTGLTAVSIPESVTAIGGLAFYDCSSLQSIVIPRGVDEISANTFDGCAALASVFIPESVTLIEAEAFARCSSLVSLDIPNSVTEIEEYAFYECGLTDIVLPAGITFIPHHAFYGCSSLRSVTFKASVSISNQAFEKCGALTGIIFEGDFGYIDSTAFLAVTATAYYPYGNETYNDGSMLDYGGELEWVPSGEIPCAVHVPGDPVRENESAATCAAEGHYDEVVYCSVCLEELSRETKTIPATGHTAVTDAAVAPTCTETGLTEGSHCSVCGEVLTAQEEVPALGHEWDEGVVTTEPTCTQAGVKTYTCKRDETHTRTEEIPATGHTAVTDAAVAPTCAETGLTEGSHCSVCGVVLTVQEEVPALGHDWDEGVVTTEPTCTQAGIKTYTCRRDGTHTCMEKISPMGHISVTDAAVAPTCDTTGLTEGSHCSVCGVVLIEQEEVPALGHDWNDGVVTTEPTCTQAGVKTYTCRQDSTHTRTEEIPKTEHTIVIDPAVEPTETSTGLTEGIHCSVCGEIIKAQEVIPAVTPTELFTDVSNPSEYYYDAVYWARDKGITTGRTPTTFDPYAPCTRGQIVTFLWRMMGEPSPASSSNPFTDVKPGDYFYNAVLWAYHRGITTGKTATTFLPYSPCTREQCVTFLWRTAGKPGASGSNPFGDVKAGTYYYDAVRWAVANGITTGRTATVFGVGQTCTRAQIVTFLYRYAG